MLVGLFSAFSAFKSLTAQLCLDSLHFESSFIFVWLDSESLHTNQDFFYHSGAAAFERADLEF